MMNMLRMNCFTTKSLNMGCKRIKMVLEIEGQVITESLVEKNSAMISEVRRRWMHTYAIKSRKLQYDIYVEIESNMKSSKFKHISFITNNINYEQSETIAECKG